MNERIYEFATKAGAYCETYLHGGDPKPPVLDYMDLEKFAELIVRECINVIGESRESRQTAMYYRHRIAKHFGVE